jgi:hypothetical protein
VRDRDAGGIRDGHDRSINPRFGVPRRRHPIFIRSGCHEHAIHDFLSKAQNFPI